MRKLTPIKNILILCFSLLFFHVDGQGYESLSAIPLGSKGVVTLETKDSVNFTFTVKSIETFSKTINSSDNYSKKLFKSSNNNCIEFVFCNGKYEDGSSKTFLFMKNWYKFQIEYNASINVDGNNRFENTSVMPLIPKALSREDWSFKIKQISFSGFKKMEINNNENVKSIDNSSNIEYIGTNKAESAFTNLSNLIITKIDTLNLSDVISIEQNMNSKDITPDHYIALGESIYPNKMKFKLETPKTYERIEDSTFTNQIEYYYTKNDGAIKAVLFEWNKTENNKDDFSSIDENPKEKAIKFQNKFSKIEKYITDKVGKPMKSNIESAKHKDPFRDDVMWEAENGLVVYLFMFGNESQHYRQIRLAIYKE